MTITGSPANTTDVVGKAHFHEAGSLPFESFNKAGCLVERTVIVDMAESGASMKATHTCMKTYFIKDRMGIVVTVTTPALHVRNIRQDLLVGRHAAELKSGLSWT